MNSDTLITQLRTLGLWPDDAPAQSAILDLGKRLPEGRALARELIQRNLLTPYQANLLLTDKGEQLVVGAYRILQRLGEGGMGQVFLARHQNTHRNVALKIIRPERLTNRNALQRFLREVQSAAKLSHTNMVRAYDADEANGLYYFAMQYVPGVDLSKLVKQSGKLPISEACNYIYQAAQGLQHIHDHGLIHRDIKPSNLMITGTAPASSPPISATQVPNVVKILDLGLARLMEDEEAAGEKRPALTQIGSIMGTADYMSPEQARDSRTVDVRSDLYSLGCTLYFALCGQPPFPGGTPIEKMLHHQLDEPQPIEKIRSEVSPFLAGVVRRLMAKRAEDRYPQAAMAAADLLPLFLEPPTVEADLPRPRELLPEFDFGDTDAPAVPRRSVGLAAWGNWLWVLVAGVAALAALVVGLIVQAMKH